jgi:hypothetical protein
MPRPADRSARFLGSLLCFDVTGKSHLPRVSILRALAVAFLIVLALPASSAWAGRVLATGHDADSHCSEADPPFGQCHFVAVAVNYARGGAPTPSRPLLLLDCTSQHFLAVAIARGLGPGIPSTTICPHSDPGFRSEPLSISRYSAIVIGSSIDQLNINATETTPDSVAISARASDITAFFNAGGGILAFSGDVNGDGLPSPPDTYYTFIPVPIGGKLGASPFTLTPAGAALGFQSGAGTSDDINCCPTHNSFQEPPAGSALQIAERDSSSPPAPETLFAQGTIGSQTIITGPNTGEVIQSPSKCVRRRKIKLRIRQPRHVRIKRASVYVNGKRHRVLKRKRFRHRRSVTVVLRHLPKRKTIRVRVVVRTTRGVTYKKFHKYRRCRARRH